MASAADHVLPSLVGLSLGTKNTDTTLFDHLIGRKSAKSKECTEHEPQDGGKQWKKMSDVEKGQFCLRDGYLMYKEVKSPASVVPGGWDLPYYSDQTVHGHSEDGREEEVRMQSMLRVAGNVNGENRANKFMKDEGRSLNFKEMFDQRCATNDEIEWDEYKEELLNDSDWFFVDDEDRGVLFVSVFDANESDQSTGAGGIKGEERKKSMGLPTEGMFAKRFLYLNLVCANNRDNRQTRSRRKPTKGFGAILMSATEALAKKLGCNLVVLATLETSATYYYKREYRFAARDGEKVDVSQWEDTRKGYEGQLLIDKEVEVSERTEQTEDPEDPETPEEERDAETETPDPKATKRPREAEEARGAPKSLVSNLYESDDEAQGAAQSDDEDEVVIVEERSRAQKRAEGFRNAINLDSDDEDAAPPARPVIDLDSGDENNAPLAPPVIKVESDDDNGAPPPEKKRKMTVFEYMQKFDPGRLIRPLVPGFDERFEWEE